MLSLWKKLWESLCIYMWIGGGKSCGILSEGMTTCGKVGFCTEFCAGITQSFEQVFYAVFNLFGGDFCTFSTITTITTTNN